MDLDAEISVPIPQPGYLHESSTKLKLMASGTNGTPVTAVEEAAAAAVVAASRTAFVEPPAAATNAPTTGATGAVTAGGAAAATNGKDATSKKPVRYRECQKNHAAGIGGHALDGCGEFMPSGEEGTMEALKCSACDCHRNFHRREVEGEPPCHDCWYKGSAGSKDMKKKPPMLPLQHTSPLAAITPSSARSPGALVALSHSNQSDEQDGHSYGLAHHLIPSAIKKRFRTKFTNEQKEKMYHFADRLGWKIQKHDEAEVQQFCADVGVKRHVLKVWMHNNKNTFGKKIS